MALTDKNITDSYSGIPTYRPFNPGDRVMFCGVNKAFKELGFEGEIYEVKEMILSGSQTSVFALDGTDHEYNFLTCNLKLVSRGVENTRAKPQMPPRQQLLEGAIKATTKERNNEYGPPTQDFDRTARLATELGFKFAEKDLEPHHVAMFMILLKLSRITWDPEKEDNWMDIAGYAGCGYECVVEGEDDR